jgi:hypothetical protein
MHDFERIEVFERRLDVLLASPDEATRLMTVACFFDEQETRDTFAERYPSIVEKLLALRAREHSPHVLNMIALVLKDEATP